MPYRVRVDQDACISAGRCVADAPTLFRFDDDEVSQVIEGAPLPSEDTLLALARACPSAALQVVDGDSVVDPF